jgi:hypothetical protein
MDALIPRFSDRPGEQKRLMRAKHALKQRMQPDLNSLLRWLGGGYVGFDALPPTLRQHALAAAHADQWTAGLHFRQWLH